MNMTRYPATLRDIAIDKIHDAVQAAIEARMEAVDFRAEAAASWSMILRDEAQRQAEALQR